MCKSHFHFVIYLKAHLHNVFSYYDNVGGSTLDAALAYAAHGARFIVSIYQQRIH